MILYFTSSTFICNFRSTSCIIWSAQDQICDTLLISKFLASSRIQFVVIDDTLSDLFPVYVLSGMPLA